MSDETDISKRGTAPDAPEVPEGQKVPEIQEVHDDDAPAFNTVLDADTPTQPLKTKPAGRGSLALVLVFALASLFGGVLGIAGNKLLQKPNTFAQTSAELSQNLAAQQTALDAQAKSIAALKSELEKSAASIKKLQASSRTMAVKNKALTQDLAATQTRLDSVSGALSTTNRPDAATDMTAKTPAAKTETNAPVNLTQKKPSAAKPALEPQNPPIKTQPKNIKTDEIKSNAKPTPQQDPLTILRDTFPRREMLDAVAKQEALAQKKPSLLQRALRKHVKMGKPSEVDQRAEIKAAQIAVTNGDIASALPHISRLNPPVRATAAQWTLAAKKYRPKN